MNMKDYPEDFLFLILQFQLSHPTEIIIKLMGKEKLLQWWFSLPTPLLHRCKDPGKTGKRSTISFLENSKLVLGCWAASLCIPHLLHPQHLTAVRMVVLIHTLINRDLTNARRKVEERKDFLLMILWFKWFQNELSPNLKHCKGFEKALVASPLLNGLYP